MIGVGYENHMLFQEGGDVPLWMTPQDSVAKTFSQYCWKKTECTISTFYKISCYKSIPKSQ